MTSKKNIYFTCSMCNHFEPNRSICTLTNKTTEAISYDAIKCKEEGKFIRYMHVVPGKYNLFKLNGGPDFWKLDLSKFPKDENNVPLFVITKRGYEKIIPADDSIVLKGDADFGVELIKTYQGQREIIYELGDKLAKNMANKQGVRLTVLPEEIGWQGSDYYINKYLAKEEAKKTKNKWLRDDVEEW